MPIGAPTYYPASPIAIRDGTWSRVRAISTFGNNVFRARLIPTKDDILPYALIHIMGERTEPWGDANAGEPRFEHALSLGVEIVMKGATRDETDGDIVNAVELVRATLMTDPTWVGLFEAMTRADVRYSYPSESNDLMIRALIEFELIFRSSWEPYMSNPFAELDLTVEKAGVYDGEGNPVPLIDDVLVIELPQ